jgi:hypothetical protein
MLRNFLANEHTKKAWGHCPNCSADLWDIKSRPPYDNCPFCAAPIEPVWWQRVEWVTLGLFLSFAAPASLGLGFWDAFFAGLLLLFPATVFAYIVVFTTMPPKYVRRCEGMITLFRR